MICNNVKSMAIYNKTLYYLNSNKICKTMIKTKENILHLSQRIKCRFQYADNVIKLKASKKSLIIKNETEETRFNFREECCGKKEIAKKPEYMKTVGDHHIFVQNGFS